MERELVKPFLFVLRGSTDQDVRYEKRKKYCGKLLLGEIGTSFSDIHLVDTIPCQNTLSNVLCLLFSCMSTDYCSLNCVYKRLALGKPFVLYSPKKVIYWDYLVRFPSFYFQRARCRHVGTDLPKCVVLKWTFGDLADFTNSIWKRTSQGPCPLDFVSCPSKCINYFVCFMSQILVCRDTTSKFLRRETNKIVNSLWGKANFHKQSSIPANEIGRNLATKCLLDKILRPLFCI